MSKSLSIVVPSFNEESRLGDSLVSILDFVQTNSIDAEIIVVDDGSTDSTKVVAEESLAGFHEIETKVISYKHNRGKGYAVRQGLASSVGDIALFSDADLSTPISEIYRLIDPITNGECDVAFGSRALDRTLIGNHQPWRREQGGKLFNLLVRTLTGLPFWDTQCGFKAFRMNKFKPLLDLMKIDRFGFDVEFLYVANLRGLKLKEIPVKWDHCDGTTVSMFRDSIRMFIEIGQIRSNEKTGKYERQRKTEN